MQSPKTKNFYIELQNYKENIINRKNYYLDLKNTDLESRIWHFPAYKYCEKFINKKKTYINNIYDFGCGLAYKTNYLKNKFLDKNFVGIDQEQSCKHAEKKYEKIKFIGHDLEKSGLHLNSQAELIICIDVIEHLNDPEILMSEIIRYLKKDGYLIISTPERELCRGKKNLAPGKHHVREWNKEEFSNFLSSFNTFKILDKDILLAYKFGFNKIAINELKNRFLRQPLKYNQIYLLQKSK